MKDVHTEHCCIRHGCKYCKEDCTVTTGKAPQSYPCEDCYEAEQGGYVTAPVARVLVAAGMHVAWLKRDGKGRSVEGYAEELIKAVDFLMKGE